MLHQRVLTDQGSYQSNTLLWKTRQIHLATSVYVGWRSTSGDTIWREHWVLPINERRRKECIEQISSILWYRREIKTQDLCDTNLSPQRSNFMQKNGKSSRDLLGENFVIHICMLANAYFSLLYLFFTFFAGRSTWWCVFNCVLAHLDSSFISGVLISLMLQMSRWNTASPTSYSFPSQSMWCSKRGYARSSEYF